MAIPGSNHIYIRTRSVGQGRRSDLGPRRGDRHPAAGAAFGLSALIAAIGLASDGRYARAGGWSGRWLRGGADRMRWQRVVATAYLALAGYALAA